MYIPLQEFAPDADFTQPGMITSCQNLVPSIRGYKAAPSAVDAGFNALASACFGSAVVRKLDNTTRFIAGAATKLYELNGASWTDVSRVAVYNASADVRWSYAQFGNVTLAANKADTLQASTTSLGAFADIATAPKAKLVETVGQFVMLADTNDGTFGDSPDRWWCGAIGSYTNWTPSVANQCVSGRLTSAPGRINALKRLGDGIVAYKDRSMFIASYVGAPAVWNWQEIPGNVGCVAQGGVVDIGAAHIFIGYDGQFWLFDGSRPTPIGAPIKDWLSDDMWLDFAYRIQTVHDRNNSRVYFYYPSKGGAGALDSCVVYNYRANKWGVDDRQIESTIDYVSAGLTYDSSFASATFDSVDPAVTFDSPLLVAGQPAPAFFNTSHKVNTLTGSPTGWSMTVNDFGDDNAFITVTRVKPRFLTAPTSCTMENFYRMNQGDSLTLDATSTMVSSRFDVIRSARWHRFSFNAVGSGEISGLDIQATQSGNE